jgi:hypothetical protein
MSALVYCPDITGKTGAIYFAGEIGVSTRLHVLGGFVCDKISREHAEVVMKALRDWQEAKVTG